MELPRIVRAAGATAFVALVSATVAACGSDDGDEAQGASGGGSSAYVQEAKRISEEATKGVVQATGPVGGYADPKAWSSIEEWPGPKTSPKAPARANLVVISCVKGSDCDRVAGGAIEAARKLHWSAKLMWSDGTPQGAATAMSSAIAKKPDAIIGVALPGEAIKPQIKDANDAGIVTVGFGDVPPYGQGPDQWAAGTGTNNEILYPLQSFAMIAASDGEANVAVVTDNEFPAVAKGMRIGKEVVDRCEGCESSEHQVQIADMQDPVKAQEIFRGILDGNQDLDYLVLPYTIPGLDAALAAVRTSGRDVQVIPPVGNPRVIEAIKADDVRFTGGISLRWSGFSALDQVIRGLTKEPYLEPAEQGYGARLFTKSNVPAGESEDLVRFVPYDREWLKRWTGSSG